AYIAAARAESPRPGASWIRYCRAAQARGVGESAAAFARAGRDPNRAAEDSIRGASQASSRNAGTAGDERGQRPREIQTGGPQAHGGGSVAPATEGQRKSRHPRSRGFEPPRAAAQSAASAFAREPGDSPRIAQRP